MDKIWIVEQLSNVDGEYFYNSVPCASYEAAREVAEKKVKALTNTDTSKYYGVDIDSEDNDAVDVFVVNKPDYYRVEMIVLDDSYFEEITVSAKELVV